MTSGERDLSNFSMLDVFRMEVETQATILNNNLIALETKLNGTKTGTRTFLETLMRAAHSIKGAARIVQVNSAVQLAHVMEDYFVAAQQGTLQLTADHVDILLQGVDWLLRIAQAASSELDPLTAYRAEIETLVAVMTAMLQPIGETIDLEHQTPASSSLELTSVAATQLRSGNSPSGLETTLEAVPEQKPLSAEQEKTIQLTPSVSQGAERVVRVSAENLNRLMGLAGESLVEANWLQPFGNSLLKLKNRQAELAKTLEKLQESFLEPSQSQRTEDYLKTAQQKVNESRQMLVDRLEELEHFSRRFSNLSDRLYREVIASHMRPFADGVQGFPRMVRDLARQLGKQVRLEIIGKSTSVDRDILEKLEAPLTHILRNAIDHGIELPEERLATGKPAIGTVRIEASHRAGMLSIHISDDGRGVDLKRLRQKIVNRGMVSAEMVTQLTETEVLEFLFLPGFSTVDSVTEISGRGVGLDVVQTMLQQVGGVVRAIAQPEKGMSFHLQLPLTLSVMRTLLVEIAGEPYAFPLTRIEGVYRVPLAEIAVVENRQYFTVDEQNIGLVAAHQVLELQKSTQSNVAVHALPTIIVSDRLSRYGLVVDRFLGERNLVVRPLDPRLGKVPDISAVGVMEDGSPVLIVDVEDLVRSVDQLLAGGQPSHISRQVDKSVPKIYKRILVVDDSITVREMERKLLENKGYKVEVSVNGMDGWNAVRTGNYDLVLTDIDMPRMNGIELLSHIKSHPKLKSLPVIIVSYKDREEDRIRGLEAGANYYLTKSSFHDHTLLNAVMDLIGEASA